MKTFFRLITIIFTVGKYRLDALLEKSEIPVKFKLLLIIFKIFPKSKLSRGRSLRLALEELGPIFVKFGQLLSTRPDLIPEDIIEELNNLQDNVAPFENKVFQQLVENALGSPVENIFSQFEKTPLASASVAQVHAAELKNGDKVIIKAVRPNIEKTIELDTSLLMLLAKIIERISVEGRRLRPIEVVEDYRHTIFDELNLSLEAANASQLRRNFENSDKLYIPKIYWEYCKSNVMVMERIYGVPVSNIEKLKEQNTNLKLLAERGVEIFFTQVFEHNFFHADMHPGNVFVSYDTPERPSYIAVDMAIVGSLTREDQFYLARNLLAMFRRDYRQVAELHVSSGWVPPETSLSGFESAIRAVCEPIFEKPLKEISFGEALITIFKTAQRYNMPVQPQLVLLQKTLLNIEGLGRQLYPELNLWDTAHPFLERWIKQRFHPQTLAKEFKHHAPEWMEKFPQIPQMLLNSIQATQTLSEATPKLLEASKKISEAQTSKKRTRKLIAVAAASLGVYSSYTPSFFISTESLLLLLIAVIAWVY